MKTVTNKILSLESLEIGYGAGRNQGRLLSPVSASGVKGELVAVIGRNGIGKSTLLRTIAGLQKPLGGKVFINDRTISDYSRTELALEVSYISTEVVKASNMSVYDLVALGRFPHTNWIGKIEEKDNDAIDNALEKTSMLSFRHRFISELSDGERQKAMIARILAQDTGVMVMDEPTAFLDVAGRYEIFHLLKILSANSGKTIICSTHDLQMATGYADKIWIISNNGLIEGAPEDLMLNGAFDHLFDSAEVRFDSYEGTFSSRSISKGNIYIEGKGKKKHWTEMAINRAGYSVSKEKTALYIIAPSENNSGWQLVTEDSISEFGTIYDLIAFLKEVSQS